ncbi:MAG: hypothetical protein R2876_06935 [Eubacteriales bacterium]
MKGLSIRWNRSTVVIAFILLLTIVLCTAGFTIAWFIDSTDSIVNSFVPGNVAFNIEENFTNGDDVKEDVMFLNTGNIDAYIRVALVPIWRDEQGEGTALTADGTYTIDWPNDYDNNWFVGDDGYYYCKTPIKPGEYSPILIDECKVIEGLSEEYDGKTFELQVIISATQAEDTVAAQEVWPVIIDGDGNLSKE